MAHMGCAGGTSMKSSDHSCIPLCPDCHRIGRFAYHRLGRAALLLRWKIDLTEVVELEGVMAGSAGWCGVKEQAYNDGQIASTEAIKSRHSSKWHSAAASRILPRRRNRRALCSRSILA
jgi:hypothetical protein